MRHTRRSTARWLIVLLPACATAPAPEPAAPAPSVSTPRSQYGADEVQSHSIVLGPDLAVTVYWARFVPERHVLTRCGDLGLCAIDGMPFFGTATVDQLPRTIITALTVTQAGVDIPLEVTGMFNAGSPRERMTDRGAETVMLDMWVAGGSGQARTLQGMFSDGGGTYYAEWLIVPSDNGPPNSMRTLLTCAECLALSARGFAHPPKTVTGPN